MASYLPPRALELQRRRHVLEVIFDDSIVGINISTFSDAPLVLQILFHATDVSCRHSLVEHDHFRHFAVEPRSLGALTS